MHFAVATLLQQRALYFIPMAEDEYQKVQECALLYAVGYHY